MSFHPLYSVRRIVMFVLPKGTFNQNWKIEETYFSSCRLFVATVTIPFRSWQADDNTASDLPCKISRNMYITMPHCLTISHFIVPGNIRISYRISTRSGMQDDLQLMYAKRTPWLRLRRWEVRKFSRFKFKTCIIRWQNFVPWLNSNRSRFSKILIFLP